MEYYILINNIKEGPYPKEELLHKGIDGDTLVWCAGMTEWKKAREIPDLSSILSQLPPEPPRSSAVMPKTWLAESILVTLFCCLPFGIIGVVSASKVSTFFAMGNYEMAQRASANAAKWTKIGFFIGLIVTILSAVFYLVTFMTIKEVPLK